MKRIALLTILQSVLIPLIAQQPVWLDPKVNSENEKPDVADYFAYENAESAQKGEKSLSARFMSIEGSWKFNFVKNAYDKPENFFAEGFDDSEWVDFPVPDGPIIAITSPFSMSKLISSRTTLSPKRLLKCLTFIIL